MNIGNRVIRATRVAFIALAFASLSSPVGVSAAPLPVVAGPVMVPPGLSDWVGSTKVSFEDVKQGRIYYTLDGSTPTIRSELYEEGKAITIESSLTVKAVHYVGGIYSGIVTGEFNRAKLPVPTARYGGKTSISSAVLCSLKVDLNGIAPTIRYTLDGSAPGPGSAVYSAPIPIAKTMTVKAYATEPRYDASPAMSVGFTWLDPPAAPVLDPGSQTFSTNTLPIKLKTTSAGTFFRYTLDPNIQNWDTAAIVPGDSISIRGQKAGEIITVMARTCKTGYPSSTITTGRYTYQPQVAAPTASKPAGYFYDTMTVTLSGEDGSSIRYTVDKSTPTVNSPDGSKPIALSATTALKAIAFKAPQPQSEMLNVSYTLRLSPPVLDKQSQEFTDTLYVKVASKCPGAFIYYTLDGSAPTTKTGVPLDPSGTIAINEDVTTLKAVAYKDSVYSELATAVYTKKAVIQTLTAPTIVEPGREFEDAIDIHMGITEADAEIRYTTDGSEPTLSSPRYGATPIHLDTTTVLRARTFPTSGNLEPSITREEHYTLTPSQPIADPMPTASFPNGVTVALSTRTRGGVIKYVLGGTPFDLGLASTYETGKPISFGATTRLQARTILVSGGSTRQSAPLDVTYEIYTGAISDTLRSDDSRPLIGGYVFANQSAGPIIARMHPPEGVSLVGFKDVSLAIELRPIQNGQALKVAYSKPAGAAGDLYRYAGGKVEFITSDNRKDLTAAGDYFVGVDTMPPVIKLLGQDVKEGDSTVLRLSVTDNAGIPACEIQSQGIANGKAVFAPDSKGEFSVALKMPGNDLNGLWFRAVSSDARTTGRLPGDPAGKMYIERAWTRLNSPAVLSLGRANSAWDMAGFPVDGSRPIRWGDLRGSNAGAKLDAAAWSEAAQNYVYLEDTAQIKPGMGFWLGSLSKVNSVSLEGFRSAGSESDGNFRMVLHPGWNQVTSPSMDKVYWPVTPAASQSPTVYVKAPYKYLPEKDDYQQCDSLEPWRGYFVHYFGMHDTTITVYSDPSKRPAAKIAAGASEAAGPVALELDFGRAAPLRLAAVRDAQDAIGPEDGPELPSLTRRFSAWSQRGRRHLVSDVIRFTAGEPLRWDIVLSDPGRAGDGTAGSGTFRVAGGKLPAGYEAWAVSSARGMRFRLENGSDIPLSGLSADTLSVYAGPLEKLAGIPEFANAATRVEHLSFDLETGRDGRILRLALPWNARVDVEVWSPSGRLLGSARPGRLTQGIYRLPLAKARAQDGTNVGVGFLRLRLNGESGPRELTRRVAW
jgi:hypothetical protein